MEEERRKKHRESEWMKIFPCFTTSLDGQKLTTFSILMLISTVRAEQGGSYVGAKRGHGPPRFL